MNYEDIKYEIADRVLTITLHRPDKLNAYTGRMRTELIDALERADADDEVRAIVFTGAGRAYCAGADLSSGIGTFNRQQEHSMEEHRDGGGRLTLRIFDLKKPVIAAVNGAAVGVGATMTLPMDVRIASTAARFGFVFARRGVVPEARRRSRAVAAGRVWARTRDRR
jgi:enoyl-CoA hydratase/carnithine racemase